MSVAISPSIAAIGGTTVGVFTVAELVGYGVSSTFLATGSVSFAKRVQQARATGQLTTENANGMILDLATVGLSAGPLVKGLGTMGRQMASWVRGSRGIKTIRNLMLKPVPASVDPGLYGLADDVANPNVYSVAYRTKLSQSTYPGFKRPIHFREANKNLLKAMDSDPVFASMIDDLVPNFKQQVLGSRGGVRGISPSGWTWHHHVETGVMELVPRYQHTTGSVYWKVLHPFGYGGMATWGK